MESAFPVLNSGEVSKPCPESETEYVERHLQNKVRDGLYIGAIGDAAEVLEKGSSKITHMLSVLSSASVSFFSEWRRSLSFPAKEIRKVYEGGCEDENSGKEDASDGSRTSSNNKLLYSLEYAGKDLKLVRMAVPIKDMESENLLDKLEVCLDFIVESRKQGGSVLVHCFAGVSRSAAVITAYLMRSEHLSHEDALESLRESCPYVCPNDGFLEQLKMFDEMGYKIGHASSVYKRFRLKVLGESYNRGEKIDAAKFGADPGLPELISSIKLEPSSGTGRNTNATTRAYRCKKCRRLIALQENVVEHIPGEGQTAFGWYKRRGGNSYSKPDEFECSSIFVEPLRWMKTVEEGGLEGKLSCAHCDARLGYFNWSGVQCSCGSWITPAFQLQKGRVDASTV